MRRTGSDVGGRPDGRSSPGRLAGIGLAIARRLGRDGMTLVLTDVDGEALRSAQDELTADGIDAVAIRAELTDEDEVRRLVDGAGELDVLVNDAGIAGPARPVWEYELSEWRRTMAINVDAVFLLCKHVVPGMIERGYGRIVNVSSISGKEGNPNMSGRTPVEGRGARADEGLRQGDRAAERVGQRRHAGRDRDRHPPPAQPGGGRLHGVEDPDGSNRPTRGGRRRSSPGSPRWSARSRRAPSSTSPEAERPTEQHGDLGAKLFDTAIGARIVRIPGPSRREAPLGRFAPRRQAIADT